MALGTEMLVNFHQDRLSQKLEIVKIPGFEYLTMTIVK
jgi:hypothetical protein